MDKVQTKQSLFSLKDVHFSYAWEGGKVNVLRGVDLEVESASFLCIVGPSGTGKTTLLNLMGLLDSPEKGTIHFSGKDVSRIEEKEAEKLRLREMGYIFQSFHLLPTLTVLENTSYFLSTQGYKDTEAKAKAKEVLERVGLGTKMLKYIGALSGGERQRVAIARALAKNPQVVIADEPTANLDRKTAEDIIQVFKGLQKAGTAFIFSTHDQHLVSHGERVLSLQDGKIVEVAK